MRWGRAAAIAVLFGLLAVTALSALWTHPGTVGDTLPHDYYHQHWGYWWMRHALATGGSIYETNYVHYPATTNLAFHTLAPFWYPLWALLEPLTGTIAAANAIMTLALTLAGALAYRLLRVEGAAVPLALAGGIIFMLTPASLFSAMLTNLNYLGVFWLPALLLLWRQVVFAPSARGAFGWALVFGAALWAALLTDLQWGLFGVFLLGPYGLWTLWRRRRALLQVLMGGLVAVGLALALLWLVGPLDNILRYDRTSFAPQPMDKAAGIPFPLGYVTRLDPYSRAISLGWLVLPAAALALALHVAKRGRGAGGGERGAAPSWLWLAMALPPLILSAGPFITVGETTISTSYVLLHEALGGVFRVPARFAPVFLVPALVFAARGLTPLYTRLRRGSIARWAAGAGIVLLALADSAPFHPMPVRPAAEPYEAYTRMGEEPYDYAVLEIPVAGGSGEAWVGDFSAMETQFYGMTHEKWMISGTFARAPLDHFWHWLYDDALFAWLGQRRWLESETVRNLLAERIQAYPIGYLALHQRLVGVENPATVEVIGFLNAQDDLLCPPDVERDGVFWRTRWHPDGCAPRTPPLIGEGVYEVDIGAPGDARHLGWGWHYAEPVGGTDWRWTGAYPRIGGPDLPPGFDYAELYVDLPPGAYRLTVEAQAFSEARQMAVTVNGEPIGEARVSPEALETFTFELPADAVGEGQHLSVRLAYDGALVPAEQGQGGDVRRLAVAVTRVRFERVGS